MHYLTIEHILQLHALVLLRDGGADGVRDVGRLRAAVATQYQTVFDELYVGPYAKTAAMIRGITGDHAFYDGNKRTSMLVGLTFLEVNGCVFVPGVGEIEDFAIEIAVKNHDIATIAEWLEKHCK